MYKSLTKIVVTGGPCGGKTSALARISRRLSDMGYEVLIIPEAATFVSNMGINANVDMLTFEEAITNVQSFNETLCENYAKCLNDKRVIIICDRGMIDCKAYITGKEWSSLVKKMNETEISIRDRYDAVFHLRTVADGKEEYYTNENNPARRESAEEASLADLKTVNAWIGHPHLRIVDNSTDFKAKLDRLMAEICSFLGVPIPIERENKYLVSMPDIDFLKSKYHAVESDIMQVYLLSKNNNEEVRIRQRGSNGNYSYYLTKKIERNDKSRYEIEERITKDRYLQLIMEADPEYDVLIKKRYCFVYNNQYFELDIYPFSSKKAILEIEITDESQEITFPQEINIIKEVTKLKKFKNSNIAKKCNKEYLKCIF